MRGPHRLSTKLLLMVITALPIGAGASPADDGRALFVGDRQLTGKIAMHQRNLPSELLRCSNCHQSQASAPVKLTVAPRLTRDWVLTPHERHGGPSTVYDLESFCVMLRTGKDPANLIVNVQMPRYEIAQSDCGSLWAYLTE
jgi:hypothetical protein